MLTECPQLFDAFPSAVEGCRRSSSRLPVRVHTQTGRRARLPRVTWRRQGGRCRSSGAFELLKRC